MMPKAEIERLAKTYFSSEVSIGSRSDNEPRATWEQMIGLIDDDPKSAWAVIYRMLAYCTASIEVSRVGTGPLETLLANHAGEILPEVLCVARDDRRIREALRYATAADLTSEQQAEVNRVLALG